MTATASPGPALVAAGFRVRSANTPMQREQLRTMPTDTFTAVRQGGATYYLYPDTQTGQLYVGDQYAYRRYFENAEIQSKRQQGIFVIRALPREYPITEIWHGWAPFREW